MLRLSDTSIRIVQVRVTATMTDTSNFEDDAVQVEPDEPTSFTPGVAKLLKHPVVKVLLDVGGFLWNNICHIVFLCLVLFVAQSVYQSNERDRIRSENRAFWRDSVDAMNWSLDLQKWRNKTMACSRERLAEIEDMHKQQHARVASIIAACANVNASEWEDKLLRMERFHALLVRRREDLLADGVEEDLRQTEGDLKEYFYWNREEAVPSLCKHTGFTYTQLSLNLEALSLSIGCSQPVPFQTEFEIALPEAHVLNDFELWGWHPI